MDFKDFISRLVASHAFQCVAGFSVVLSLLIIKYIFCWITQNIPPKIDLMMYSKQFNCIRRELVFGSNHRIQVLYIFCHSMIVSVHTVHTFLSHKMFKLFIWDSTFQNLVWLRMMAMGSWPTSTTMTPVTPGSLPVVPSQFPDPYDRTVGTLGMCYDPTTEVPYTLHTPNL